MLRKLKKFKHSFTKSLWRDSFYRDVVMLMLVSIVIGSVLASSVALSANAYFSKTLSNLVGDYGEYDLVIQSREEMKTDTAIHIQKIINEAFPGARMKEGPTISGKTTFFVALPDEYKTQATYENLGKTFGGIPGGAGVGVITDPRMTIRGVPEGAKNMLIGRIMKLDGVKFAFHDGASVGVILKSLDKSAAVKQEIDNILRQYQVIEISFPVGSEPSNPIRLGENIADSMQKDLKLDYAQDVSVDGKNDDMTYMVSTMMELRRFLKAYASKVTVAPNQGTKLEKGDVLVFQGNDKTIAVGSPVDKGNVLVEITGINADGSAEGAITQGDASFMVNTQGYKMVKNTVGAAVGMASYRNPRQQLSGALNETNKLVGQIPGFAKDAQNLATVADGALTNYTNSIAAIDQTLQSVQNAGNTLQSTVSGLSTINTSGLAAQVNNSSQAIGGLLNTMQVIKLINPDVNSAIDNLTSAQTGLNSLKSGLDTLDNISGEAAKAKSAIDAVVTNGQNTVATLRSFDADSARKNLQNANSRLAQLNGLNAALITSQLQYMAAAAPNLKDEDISHSVKLLDKFIAGQVIPGERIQILTSSDVSADAVAPIVYKLVGHKNVSLYPTSLGVIEPNPRGELATVLNQVKEVLAGMTAMVATLLFLILDHTAIMAVLRRNAAPQQGRGLRKWMNRMAQVLAAPERCYGMVVGAMLLTAMFLIAKGGIPYLPLAGVPIIGACLGWFVAGYAEKISPVSNEEVLAGEALGLSLDEIMREIVVPNARPGLLQKLNQRKLKFR